MFWIIIGAFFWFMASAQGKAIDNYTKSFNRKDVK